jgi:hypothetical protein
MTTGTSHGAYLPTIHRVGRSQETPGTPRRQAATHDDKSVQLAKRASVLMVYQPPHAMTALGGLLPVRFQAETVVTAPSRHGGAAVSA